MINSAQLSTLFRNVQTHGVTKAVLYSLQLLRSARASRSHPTLLSEYPNDLNQLQCMESRQWPRKV